MSSEFEIIEIDYAPPATNTAQHTTEALGAMIRRAEQRARERFLPFRGLLTPKEAWRLIQEHPAATLIDIRSEEELALIGRVPGAIEIEWKQYPDWNRNPRFDAEIRRALAPDALIVLLCRSGVRSNEAATHLAAEGLENCFNVLEGFEGDKNPAGQRVINGWKVRGLPWSH